MTTSELKNKFLNDFIIFSSKMNGNELPFINDIRKNAIALFDILGFPTQKHEEWKYVNLGFLTKKEFNQDLSNNYDIQEIGQYLKENSLINSENRLVFVNGYFSEELSKINLQKENIIITGFAEAQQKYPELISEYYLKNLDYRSDTFLSLNTAFAKDGAFIYVPKNNQIYEPISIIYVNDVRNSSVYNNPRNLIIVEQNSNIKLLETCFNIGSEPSFVNSVSEIFIGKHSKLEHIKVQNDINDLYFIGNTLVNQKEESVLDSITISINGKFIRNNLTTILNGKHAEANLNGFYFTDEDHFVDNHTLVDHSVAECNSNEFYKGIIADKSTAVFNGKIIVRQDAQKTNAYQSNKNLLLGDDANINTKPQLEIFADDVKCSHGATTGYLDFDALFYLKSRGISEEKAKSLLIKAFASEIIDIVPITELRDVLSDLISDKLKIDRNEFKEIREEVI